MEAKHFPFELTQAAGGRLDDKQMLAGGFELALPSIEGLNLAVPDINARGEALFHDSTRNLPRQGKGWAGNEDDPSVYGLCAIRFGSLHGHS